MNKKRPGKREKLMIMKGLLKGTGHWKHFQQNSNEMGVLKIAVSPKQQQQQNGRTVGVMGEYNSHWESHQQHHKKKLWLLDN